MSQTNPPQTTLDIIVGGLAIVLIVAGWLYINDWLTALVQP